MVRRVGIGRRHEVSGEERRLRGGGIAYVDSMQRVGGVPMAMTVRVEGAGFAGRSNRRC